MIDTPSPSPAAGPIRRERIAITQIFFANGLGIGAWAASIPHVKSAFALSDGTLSLALLAFAAGAVVAMPLAGTIAPRLRSGPSVRLSSLVFAVALGVPALSAGLASLAVAAIVLGAANGLMDVLMNAHASDVEGRWKAPIMSSIHAAFSCGGLAGAAMGSLLGWLAPGLGAPLPVASLVAMGLIAGAWRGLDGGSRVDAVPTFALPDRQTLWLCAAAFASMLCEGAMADWSAVYLATITGAGAVVAGAGYAAFSAAMVLGRLGGDGIVGRIGRPGVVRWGALSAAAGLALAALVPSPLVAAIGFALVGLGLSNVVPLIFSAAGRIGAARGIAMAATAGYAGFLGGPPLVGATATVAGLRWSVALLAIVALALVPLGRAARSDATEPDARRQPA